MTIQAAPITKQTKAQHREDFWYGIPGCWFGTAQPFAENAITCYAVIDASRAWDAFRYFQAHHRSVRVTGTATPVSSHAYGENGLRIEYVWLKDEKARQSN